jgi:hypothetical protein
LSILSNGKATTILPSTGSVTVQALVTDTTARLPRSKLVAFSADSTLAKFVPSTGTALTDSNGIATVSMSAASLSAAGLESLPPRPLSMGQLRRAVPLHSRLGGDNRTGGAGNHQYIADLFIWNDYDHHEGEG